MRLHLGWRQRLIQLLVLLLYFGIGCAFYTTHESKACESEGCEDRCERFSPLSRSRPPGICEERWTVVDSLYFIMATISTVGYGDFYPTNNASSIFTTFWIVLGVPWMFVLMTDGLLASVALPATWIRERVVQPLVARCFKQAHDVYQPSTRRGSLSNRLSKSLQRQSTTDRKSRMGIHDGSGGSRIARWCVQWARGHHRGHHHHYLQASAFDFWCSRLIPLAISFLLFTAVTIFGFGGVLYRLQPAWAEALEWEYAEYYGEGVGESSAMWEAFWHGVVTCTAVGYNSGPKDAPGFVEPHAQAARGLATLHIALCVTWLGHWVSIRATQQCAARAVHRPSVHR